MTYTVLRVIPAGVVLFDGHAARLGDEARPAFDDFAAQADPGIYALTFEGGALSVERRAESRLHSATIEREAVSPYATWFGTFEKPKPPCAYDAVRASDTVTLLTDLSGGEVYEACTAAVVAWDGTTLVLPPADRPRVASIAEAYIAAHFPHRRAPLRHTDAWPWLLINAVSYRQVGGVPFVPLVSIREAIEATATKPT